MQDGRRCVHKSVYLIMGLIRIPLARRFKKRTSKSTYSATTAATTNGKCWTSVLKGSSRHSDSAALAQKGGQALALPVGWGT